MGTCRGTSSRRARSQRRSADTSSDSWVRWAGPPLTPTVTFIVVFGCNAPVAAAVGAEVALPSAATAIVRVTIC